MILASELRNGMAIRLAGEAYRVLHADHHAGQGKMGGVAHAKLRNLATGALREQRFRADEGVETLEMERQAMQFLYGDETAGHFMNPETFEQADVERVLIGKAGAFLTEGMVVSVQFLDGRPVGVDFPEQIEIRVAETAPPFHARSDESVWKEAVLEGGATILVPPFIAPGERIRVDVETGTYRARAKPEKER